MSTGSTNSERERPKPLRKQSIAQLEACPSKVVTYPASPER